MPRCSTKHLLGLCTPLLCGCLLAADDPLLIDRPPAEGWVDVAVVGYNACALQADGSLWCDEDDDFDEQIELEDLRLQEDGHYQMLSGLQSGICGIRLDGTLECGLAADGGFLDTDPFTQVSGDWMAGCGLLADGGVECWPEYSSATGPFTSIGAGDRFACGIREATSSLQCWSIGHVVFEEALRDVPSGTYQQVETAGHAGCAISTQGSIRCWGDAFADELLEGPPPGRYVDLSLYTDTACAVTETGSAVCWGDSLRSTALEPPEDVLFDTIDVGSSSACGIDLDSRLHCW